MILFLNMPTLRTHMHTEFRLGLFFSFLFENDSVIIGLDSIGTFEGTL